ncbi:unnamed protein product [Ixodes pacificus]
MAMLVHSCYNMSIQKINCQSTGLCVLVVSECQDSTPSLSRVSLSCKDGHILKLNMVIVDVGALGNSAALVVKFVHIVSVLANPFMKVLSFANVCIAGNFIDDAICSFLESAIFWPGHMAPKY